VTLSSDAKSTVLNERCYFSQLLQDHIQIAPLNFNSLRLVAVVCYDLKVFHPRYVINEYAFRNSTVTHKTKIQSIILQVPACSKPPSDLISSRTINKHSYIESQRDALFLKFI
jgi:hypothetical protein